MGNKIKDIGILHFGKNIFTIELNNPDAPEKEIHIQNESFRIALSERYFYKIGTDILLARKQLLKLKGLDIEEK